MTDYHPDLDRPIWGADAIARELGVTRPAAYHMLARGVLDATKLGRSWVSTRRRLLAKIVRAENEAA